MMKIKETVKVWKDIRSAEKSIAQHKKMLASASLPESVAAVARENVSQQEARVAMMKKNIFKSGFKAV